MPVESPGNLTKKFGCHDPNLGSSNNRSLGQVPGSALGKSSPGSRPSDLDVRFLCSLLPFCEWHSLASIHSSGVGLSADKLAAVPWSLWSALFASGHWRAGWNSALILTQDLGLPFDLLSVLYRNLGRRKLHFHQLLILESFKATGGGHLLGFLPRSQLQFSLSYRPRCQALQLGIFFPIQILWFYRTIISLVSSLSLFCL